jgi:hypothetical protein
VTRARRRFLVVLAGLGIALLVAGTVIVIGDANARTAAAVRVVDELSDFYEDEEGYQMGPRGPVLRSMVADSVANDGPMPDLVTREMDGYSSASYGAFGGIFSVVVLQRPWSPRVMIAPVAAGGVILITVLLVGASGWVPRRRGGRGAE